MRTKFTVVAVILTLVFLAVFFYFKGKRYEVVITQEQIDEMLVNRFPHRKQYLRFFQLTYSNPRVQLLSEADRVEVSLDVLLNMRIEGQSRELGGGAAIASGLSYDADAQEFYLHDIEIIRLEVQGIPEAWVTPVAEFATKVAQDFLTARPIYRLEAKDAKTAAAKLLLKDFEVENQEIHVTLGI